ncbi:MAG: BamA/TamA family outer membrane protein [Gemmatimonadota bacterium]
MIPVPERWAAAALAALLVTAAPAAAQEARQIAVAPERAAELFDFFNRPETVRMTGASRIARGTEIVGDVAVLGGPLQLAGRVRGSVVVLNGDAFLEPGATVDGDLVVVGGTVTGVDSATVTGRVEVYREPLRYRMQDGLLVAAQPEVEPAISTGREFGFGRSDLTIASRRGYNRVEGLPILLGPRFETLSRNPTRVEAFVIYRTETGVDVDASDFGYLLRLEQFLGGRRALRVGATLHSEIVPIESWGLTDSENALATFLLRRDFRDHYERVGWSAYLRAAPEGGRYDIQLGYQDERHSSVGVAAPWTPFGSTPWRPQPHVAEGRLRSVVARFAYDTRNEGVDPTTGWWIRAEVERGLGGSLRMPIIVDDSFLRSDDGGVLTEPVETEFAAAFVDLRRYARVSPSSTLALRVVTGTSLNDRPLPPQRQRALGGEGSLPAYRPFQFDCGAREAGPMPDGLLAFYGCDRLVLLQLEYRTAFPFGHGWGRKLGSDIDLGERPGWVVFFDAGRAWTERAALNGRTDGLDGFAADVGFGLRLGRLGLYWAAPLSGREDHVNFFIRLGTRL